MIQFEPKECATLGRFANRLTIFGLKKKVYFFLSFVDKRFLLLASSEYEWQKSN